MSLNYSFLVDQVERLVGTGTVLLDYGCGRGELLDEALKRKHEALGCDTYYGGSNLYGGSAPCRDRIFNIDPNTNLLPFQDEHFDVVVANQVFEHIEDIHAPLEEIHRVLKIGGLFLNFFPTRDIVWEGHIKAPFAQFFFDPPTRWDSYLSMMYRLGIGANQRGASLSNWKDRYRSMPTYCFYRSTREVKENFSRHFEILQDVQAEWMRHRLAHSRLNRLRIPGWADPILSIMTAKLAGRIFVLQRKN